MEYEYYAQKPSVKTVCLWQMSPGTLDDVAAQVARTPQAVRSARTRTRLLDATVECLSELGYARTTTTEVCRRAGVSRGAQLHHFPTKVELVAAAIEHAFEQRMAAYAEALADAPPDADRIQLSIDVLWAMFSGPACDAYIELAVAARTDDELRPYAHAVSERHRVAVEELFQSLLDPATASSPFADVASKFLLALFDGLMLHRGSGYDEAPGRADAVVDAAKALAAIAFGRR
jgi:AcrR family transcriptional regulator